MEFLASFISLIQIHNDLNAHRHVSRSDFQLKSEETTTTTEYWQVGPPQGFCTAKEIAAHSKAARSSAQID